VQVVGGELGRVEVDDAADIVDVDATGHHVGGNEGRHLAAVEVGQGPLPLAPAAVAVDGGGVDLPLAELASDAIRRVLGAGEDERATAAAGDVSGDVEAVGRVD
jgi:hypothetical protein